MSQQAGAALAVVGLAASAALGTGFCETNLLTASEGMAGDDFGAAVDVDGALAVAGAPEADGGLGAAYVYLFEGQWSQVQKLTASNAASGDDFGFSVGISGDRIVVGAPRDDTLAGGNAGSIYVFRLEGGMWIEQANLVADDAEADDRLGHSVAIDGGTILAGAINEDEAASNAGAGYVFVLNGTWSQQAKLVAAAPSGTNPQMGHSAALDGDVAVLGAWQDAPDGQFSVGAAHVFERSGTVWTEQQKLIASDATDFRWFGQSVAIRGVFLAVGAYGDQADGLSESGGVYFFVHDGESWLETDNVHASDAAADDRFGWSVGVDSNRAVIGTGVSAAKAYQFVFSGGTWSEAAMLDSSSPEISGEYGYAVALEGDAVLVGDRQGLAGAGLVAGFGIGPAICGCPWDLDGCGSVDINDLITLLSAWGPNPGHPADFDGDGVVGVTDLIAMLANWGSC